MLPIPYVLPKKEIDQIQYIKIQPKTIDLSLRLWGITAEFLGFISRSLMLRSIVLGGILIYQNWSIIGLCKTSMITR